MEQSVTKILVVEDEPDLLFSIREGLTMAGHEVATAGGLKEALALSERAPFDLVLTDLNLIGESGLDLIRRLRAEEYDGAIIVMTAYGTVESAVAAMKQGADDYLQKPVSLDELTMIVRRGIEQRRSQRRLRAYERLETRRAEESGEEAVGSSAPWKETLTIAQRLAQMPLPAQGAELPTILLLGETGAGKGLIARRIHAAAAPAGAEGAEPFVHVNCAALPGSLVESELFGHEKGAFTDAREARTGLFETAEGGTIFLDEIGETPLEFQSKLLLVLERGVFRRVGGSKERHVRCRVIAATNQDLHAIAAEGRFRRDLLYRLSAFTVKIPSLRERAGDVDLIAEAMLKRFARRYGRKDLRFGEEARGAMRSHAWPGNVRELVNCVQRAAMLAEGPVVTARDLALDGRPGPAGPGPGAGAGRPIATTADLKFDFSKGSHNADEVERTLIVQALQHTRGNISKAAKLIGMNRTSLRYRIERAGLEDFLRQVAGS